MTDEEFKELARVYGFAPSYALRQLVEAVERQDNKSKLDSYPFNLTADDIRLMAGEITPDEMRLIKAVLNGIKAKL